MLFTSGALVAPRSVAWALGAPEGDRSIVTTALGTSAASPRTAVTMPLHRSAPLGEPVTFVVTNAGGGRHDLVVKLEFRGIQQRSLATNLLPGEPREATFTFGASVDWETECPVGKHRALGMQGTIHVSE